MMISLRYSILLSLVFACLIKAVLAVEVEPLADVQQVEVTGRGIRYEEASKDAIRQALQKVYRQLVVADRIVENNHAVQDKIMSTMKGYVNDFKELRVYGPIDGQILVDAHISVSSARILNFIGLGNGNTSSLNGSLLKTDSEQQILQRKAAGEIFDRLLKGFPTDAIKADVVAATPTASDPRNIDLDISVEFSKPWLDSLTSGLDALSIGKLQMTVEEIQSIYGSNEIPTDFIEARINEKVRSAIATGRFTREWGARFCMYNVRSATCYILPPGDYGDGLFTAHKGVPGGSDWHTHWPILALHFLNAKNQLLNNPQNSCVVRNLNINEYSHFFPRLSSDEHYTLNTKDMYIGHSFAIYNLTGRTKVLINTAEVDFSSTSSVVAVPFLEGARNTNNGNFVFLNYSKNEPYILVISDITSNSPASRDICGIPIDRSLQSSASRQ